MSLDVKNLVKIRRGLLYDYVKYDEFVTYCIFPFLSIPFLFLPLPSLPFNRRDARIAKRGIAIVGRPSVCL